MANTRSLSGAILHGLSPPLPHYSTAEFTFLVCHRTGSVPLKAALFFCFKDNFEAHTPQDQESMDMVWQRHP